MRCFIFPQVFGWSYLMLFLFMLEIFYSLFGADDVCWQRWERALAWIFFASSFSEQLCGRHGLGLPKECLSIYLHCNSREWSKNFEFVPKYRFSNTVKIHWMCVSAVERRRSKKKKSGMDKILSLLCDSNIIHFGLTEKQNFKKKNNKNSLRDRPYLSSVDENQWDVWVSRVTLENLILLLTLCNLRKRLYFQFEWINEINFMPSQHIYEKLYCLDFQDSIKSFSLKWRMKKNQHFKVTFSGWDIFHANIIRCVNFFICHYEKWLLLWEN